jgi:hypothetical protein
LDLSAAADFTVQIDEEEAKMDEMERGKINVCDLVDPFSHWYWSYYLLCCMLK